MRPVDFFHSHAGKSVAGVCLAGLLIVWPPSVSWIAAVALLQFGVRHLILAFREMERDEQAHTHGAADIPSLAAPDSERSIVVARHGAVPARSQMD
jgi:hypothetical protein